MRGKLGGLFRNKNDLKRSYLTRSQGNICYSYFRLKIHITIIIAITRMEMRMLLFVRKLRTFFPPVRPSRPLDPNVYIYTIAYECIQLSWHHGDPIKAPLKSLNYHSSMVSRGLRGPSIWHPHVERR